MLVTSESILQRPIKLQETPCKTLRNPILILNTKPKIPKPSTQKTTINPETLDPQHEKIESKPPNPKTAPLLTAPGLKS